MAIKRKKKQCKISVPETGKKDYGYKRNLFPNSERNTRTKTIVLVKKLVGITATAKSA